MSNLINQFVEEMESDDCSTNNKEAKLKQMYKFATKEEKVGIDRVFITLCGWSLKTLIENSGDE